MTNRMETGRGANARMKRQQETGSRASLKRRSRCLYRDYLKRCLDFCVAFFLLIGLSPVMLAVAMVVRCTMGRPIVFRQPRAGKEGQIFHVFKFRSMIDAVDASGRPLSDAERLTPLGRRLRSWSLDELPQLWNVLRGDMSLIGPRPLLVSYLPRYSPEQARRHEVRPGITGWAQVHGRNELNWEKRFELDVWYVDHCGLGTDLLIIWQTLFCVLSRRGVSAYNQATMSEFMGSASSSSPSQESAS